jgi:hypothetical protein
LWRAQRSSVSCIAAAGGLSPRSQGAAAPGGVWVEVGEIPAPAVELLQIVGSRSLLVDVHLLGGAGDR